MYTTSSVSVPVYDTITSFPRMMIDNLSSLQQIVIDYFDHAGIPSSAYGIGPPATLSACYDLWINPHGDPRWADYQYLYDFVTSMKGNIWSQCHACSVMEGVYGTAALSGGGSSLRRLNYLASDGLQCWKGGGGFNCDTMAMQAHSKSSTGPYTYNYSSDPVMQFMGEMDNPTGGGSEQWFIPQTTGAWRVGTKALVTTSDAAPAGAKGVLMVYGPAYGDSDNGLVMYTGGHDLDATGSVVSEWVAAQRSFLNYVLVAGIRNRPAFSSYSIPDVFNQYHGQQLQAMTTDDTLNYTFQWSSTIHGTFSNSAAATTFFMPGNYTFDTTGAITVSITDACNRTNFVSVPYQFFTSPLPVTLGHFGASVAGDRVLVDWLTMSEVNNDYFTVERSADGMVFDEIGRVDGSGTTSTATKYRYIDERPLEGISFYRLKQTDFDGRTEIFSNARVELKSKQTRSNTLKTYPNPFVAEFSAQFVSDQPHEVTIEMTTISGKTVYSQAMPAQQGVNVVTISPYANLAPGIYMLQVTHEGLVLAAGRVLRKYY